MNYWSNRADREIFGTSAERLIARLFSMNVNPLNSSRPDLTRADTNPKLTIEVKSGKSGKGIMVVDQLYYGLNTLFDYDDEEIDVNKGLLPGFDWVENTQRNDSQVAYYYAIVERVDGLSLSDVRFPYGSIKAKFADICIVPHDLASTVFFSSWARRTNTEYTELRKKAIELLIDYKNRGIRPHQLRKKIGTNAWQNLDSKLIKYLIFNDNSLKTIVRSSTQKDLEEQYFSANPVRPIVFENEFRHNVYGLIKQEHQTLFTQITKELQKTSLKTIACAQLREEHEPSIGRFQNIDVPFSTRDANGGILGTYLCEKLELSDTQARIYESLVHWNVRD